MSAVCAELTGKIDTLLRNARITEDENARKWNDLSNRIAGMEASVYAIETRVAQMTGPRRRRLVSPRRQGGPDTDGDRDPPPGRLVINPEHEAPSAKRAM